MRIAVLCSPKSWYLRDLQRAAGSTHQVFPASYQQLHSELSGCATAFHSGNCTLAEVDCVLVRSMPPGSLEQIVFRMDLLGQLAARGVPVINSPRAIETAVDKYIATARLQAAGLTVPRTMVCQTVDDAMRAFESLGGDAVVKPLFGSEGRGILRVSDEAIAWRTFKALAELDRVIYLQRFIEHEGSDLRLLVIGKRVLGMRRTNLHDWRTNISRGAVAEPLAVSSELETIAHQAANAVGATLAGVDLLPASDGQLYALEVNAVPGWRALAETTDTDVARLVLEYLQAIQPNGKRDA